MTALHGRRAGRGQPAKPSPPMRPNRRTPRPTTPWPPVTAPAGRRTPANAATFTIASASSRPRWPAGANACSKDIAADPARFPCECTPLAPREDADLQARFDDAISYLREIARILAVLYGTPDLGNKPDPTDELVYIILARHTCEGAYQPAFDLLKKRFPRWDDLLAAPTRWPACQKG
jgi:hypothetical protein